MSSADLIPLQGFTYLGAMPESYTSWDWVVYRIGVIVHTESEDVLSNADETASRLGTYGLRLHHLTFRVTHLLC